MRNVKPAQFGWALAAAIAVLWVFAAPSFWVFTGTAAILLAISVVGLTVVLGWVHEVSLAQAGLTGVAVYVGGYAYRAEGGWGLPFIAAAALAIAVVVALSVVVALATARLSGIYIVVLTLALQMTLERTVFSYEQLTGGGLSSLSTPRPVLFGIDFRSDRAFYFLCLAALAGGLVLLSRLRVTRQGRGMLLVGLDRQAAASVGVSPWRSKIFAFAIAGFFAGVAGVLTAPLYGTPPSPVTYSALSSLFYLAIPVCAGLRSLVGVAVVAVMFGLAPQALEPLRISTFLLGGVGLIGGTLAGRAGITGLVQNQARSWRRRRVGPRADARLDVEADRCAEPHDVELRSAAATVGEGR